MSRGDDLAGAASSSSALKGGGASVGKPNPGRITDDAGSGSEAYSGPRQTTSTDGSFDHPGSSQRESPTRRSTGRVAAGDLDGDGRAERVRAIRPDMEPDLGIATGDVDGDGVAELNGLPPGQPVIGRRGVATGDVEGDGIAIDESGVHLRESPTRASTGRVIGPDMEPDTFTIGEPGVQRSGLHTAAHEAAHTVQQGAGRVIGPDLEPDVPDIAITEQGTPKSK